jgi:tetratricopeptide (TPR) repeat protein
LGLALAVSCFVVALGLGLHVHRHTPTFEEVLRGRRFTETRLAYPGVSAYVEPWLSFNAGHARPPLSLATLTEVESRHDAHALAIAYLSQGEVAKARKALLASSDVESVEVQNDLAAVELEAAEPESAIERLDRLLEHAPDDPRANWNRALALQALGLDVSAAEAFERSAKAAEPGWASEANSRAFALREGVQNALDAWNRIQNDGEWMVAGGAVLDREQVRRRPGPARLLFYAALASAQNATQANRLKPLAVMLDQLAEDPNASLVHEVDLVVAKDFVTRLPLALAYRDLRKGLVDGADLGPFQSERRRLLNQIVESDQHDIALAALTINDSASAPFVPLERHLKAWVHDPWYELAGEEIRAHAVEFEAVDYASAESALRGVEAKCHSRGLGFLCADVEMNLAMHYDHLDRLPEAEAVAKRGLVRARALNEYPLENSFYELLGEINRYKRSRALNRAYLHEAALRNPRNAQVNMEVHLSLALSAMLDLQSERSLEELKQAQHFLPTPPLLSAQVYAEAFRRLGRPELQTLGREQIASSKGRRTPEEEPFAEYLEGMLETSPERARAHFVEALRQVASIPGVSEDAAKVGSYSQMELAFNATNAGQLQEAMVWVARDLHVEAPTRCALALALDSGRVLGVALGPDGKASSRWLEQSRADNNLDLPRELPADLLETLKGCETVDVLARAPLHGRSRLLPPEFAWRHRAGARETSGPVAEVKLDRPHASAALPPDPSRLVVFDAQPPTSLELPHLAPWQSEINARTSVLGNTTILRGPDATPSKVLAQMENATEVEIHAHGFVDLAMSDASMIALSPEAGGRYALTVPLIRAHHFRNHPIVLLAACRSAVPGPQEHKAWSLPTAFIDAGAEAVFATRSDVPDTEAPIFFGELLSRIRRGEKPAIALRQERIEWLRRDPNSWVQDVVLFQ